MQARQRRKGFTVFSLLGGLLLLASGFVYEMYRSNLRARQDRSRRLLEESEKLRQEEEKWLPLWFPDPSTRPPSVDFRPPPPK